MYAGKRYSPSSMKDEVRKGYLKGFEAGLKEAWQEISRLTTRGYSSTELSIMAKSKLAVISRDVETKARQLQDTEIDIEKEEITSSDELPDRKGSYIVREEKADVVFTHLNSLLGKGRKALCMTRMHPSLVNAHFGKKHIKLLWLSRSEIKISEGVQSVSPTELAKLATQTVNFMEKEKKSAILLEGIEYLISQNGFPTVLRFLQSLSEKSALHDCYLLLSVNPQAMSEKEYRQLAREMTGEL